MAIRDASKVLKQGKSPVFNSRVDAPIFQMIPKYWVDLKVQNPLPDDSIPGWGAGKFEKRLH